MSISQEKEFTYKFIDLIETKGFLLNRVVKVFKNYIVPRDRRQISLQQTSLHKIR